MSGLLSAIKEGTRKLPVDIESIIRGAGIELVTSNDLDPEIAGMIENLGEDRYRITVNKSDHYFRRRFTMAHELGHYVLHKNEIGSGTDDNRKYRSTERGLYYNTMIKQSHEDEANRFASLVLMPGSFIRQHIDVANPHLNDWRKLSGLFQASPAALKLRVGIK